MNETYEKLCEILLPAVRQKGDDKELLGGALPFICSGCQADASYCASLADSGSRAKARFFVLADYCSYLPYGVAGIRFLTERLAGENKTVGQLRMNKLKELLGSGFGELSAESREELADFLNDDGTRTLDLRTVAGAVLAVCRIYHACEANFGNAGYMDFLEVADRTSDIMQPFAKGLAAGETPSVQGAPPLKELSEKQKKILLKVAGLK